MDDLLVKLRESGERITLPRKLVLEVLQASGTHVTVEDVCHAVEKRGHQLDSPTVYRILQWLKEMGIISQTDLGSEAIVYQLVGESRHHHLVCLSCGKITDMEDAMLDSLRRCISTGYGFEPRIDHLAIFGLCTTCRVHE